MTLDTTGHPATDARPRWAQYLLDTAAKASTQPLDPQTRHGCMPVDAVRRVLSTGYDGPVSELPPELIRLDRPSSTTPYIHAEENAEA